MDSKKGLETEVYGFLSAALGHRPHEAIWKTLIDPDDDWLGRPFIEVFLEYEKLRRLLRETGAYIPEEEEIDGLQHQAMAEHLREELPSTDADQGTVREEVLSAGLAVEAARGGDVAEFRQGVLAGRLMNLEAVDGWVRSQSESEGSLTPILNLSRPVPREQIAISSDRKRAWLDPPLNVEEVNPVKEMTFPILSYIVSQDPWPRRRPVAVGGVLDQLRVLGEKLSKRFPWEAAQATSFVLTGAPPFVSTIKVKHRINLKTPTRSRIEMVIDPVARPEQVMQMYREARAEVAAGDRIRIQSVKHLKLAAFFSQRPDSEEWAARMKAWNKRFPNYKYKNLGDFKRDCHVARERLLFPKYQVSGG